MGRVKNQRKNHVLKILLAFMITVIILCIAAFLLIRLQVEPNLEEVSKVRAESLMSKSINMALIEQFQADDRPENLFIVKKGENGKLELVQADAIAINLLLTQLTAKLQETFKEMDSETLQVPIGALLGSQILSQIGPSVNLEIMPISILSTDFKTEFETQGINQTKYKIYIILNCKVKTLAPFSSATFNTSSTVLIAETVILGDVPDSFVQVPKESLLDVTNQ